MKCLLGFCLKRNKNKTKKTKPNKTALNPPGASGQMQTCKIQRHSFMFIAKPSSLYKSLQRVNDTKIIHVYDTFIMLNALEFVALLISIRHVPAFSTWRTQVLLIIMSTSIKSCLPPNYLSAPTWMFSNNLQNIILVSTSRLYCLTSTLWSNWVSNWQAAFELRVFSQALKLMSFHETRISDRSLVSI